MRHKLPEEEKKKKISITIDKKLNDLLEKHLENIDAPSKWKYIEILLKKDLD